MALYIINTPVLTNFGEYRFEKIDIKDARNLLLNNKFISAVGHQGSSVFLTRLLGIEIKTNRIEIFMEPGDLAVILKLKKRLPEGVVLSEEEIQKFEFDLGLLTRIK